MYRSNDNYIDNHNNDNKDESDAYSELVNRFSDSLGYTNNKITKHHTVRKCCLKRHN